MKECCGNCKYNKRDFSKLQESEDKAIGNGWTVDVIAHIFRGLNDESN